MGLKFKFTTNNSKVFLAGNLNFKFRIVFWNLFLEILRFEKRIALSEKMPTLQVFCFVSFDSFLGGLGRYGVYSLCCSVQTIHKPV